MCPFIPVFTGRSLHTQSIYIKNFILGETLKKNKLKSRNTKKHFSTTKTPRQPIVQNVIEPIQPHRFMLIKTSFLHSSAMVNHPGKLVNPPLPYTQTLCSMPCTWMNPSGLTFNRITGVKLSRFQTKDNYSIFIYYLFYFLRVPPSI